MSSMGVVFMSFNKFFVSLSVITIVLSFLSLVSHFVLVFTNPRGSRELQCWVAPPLNLTGVFIELSSLHTLLANRRSQQRRYRVI